MLTQRQTKDQRQIYDAFIAAKANGAASATSGSGGLKEALWRGLRPAPKPMPSRQQYYGDQVTRLRTNTPLHPIPEGKDLVSCVRRSTSMTSEGARATPVDVSEATAGQPPPHLGLSTLASGSPDSPAPPVHLPLLMNADIPEEDMEANEVVEKQVKGATIEGLLVVDANNHCEIIGEMGIQDEIASPIIT